VQSPDGVVLLRLGVGRLAIAAPCRVVYVASQARCRGFAYGRLPGHQVCGEEAFILEEHDDGLVVFTITAFS
jgi:uncharacterized protein (UPF0548 family)